MNIPLTKGSYLVDGEQAINLYPVFNDAKKVYEFLGTEGLLLLKTLSSAPIRGLYVATNDDTKLYAVAGKKVFRVNTDYTYDQYTTELDTTTGLVEFSDNGIEVTITDGTYGYTITIATAPPSGLVKIGDADFPGAASNCFLDGYTIVVKPNSQTGYSSDLYASNDWDAINFASAEGLPDNLIRCVEHNQLLWLFGILSTEPFVNDGGAGFPFSRYQGAVLGFGLAAKYSLAKSNQAMYFLARTRAAEGERVIVEVRGLQANIVSNQGINDLLATLTNTANAEGFAYMRGGHSFYELTFPSDNVTLIYDSTEQLWHERKSRDANGNKIRHRVRCYAYFNGHHIVGDYAAGKIYELKPDVYTENETIIERELITPELIDIKNDNKFVVSELIVPMKVGVGNATTDQREDVSFADGTLDADGSVDAGSTVAAGGPILMMRYSKDRAMTWSNEKHANFGKQGEYTTRVRFRRLGQMRRLNVKLSISDAVQVRFTGPLIIPGG